MATLQGYFRKLPSLAVSLAINGRIRKSPHFDVAARVTEHLAREIKTGNMPTDTILNVNVPDIPMNEIKGIVSTKMAVGGYVNLASVQQGGGIRYAAGVRKPGDVRFPEGTDIWAITAGMISVTPLRPEITDHAGITALFEPLLKVKSDLLVDS